MRASVCVFFSLFLLCFYPLFSLLLRSRERVSFESLFFTSLPQTGYVSVLVCACVFVFDCIKLLSCCCLFLFSVSVLRVFLFFDNVFFIYI